MTPQDTPPHTGDPEQIYGPIAGLFEAYGENLYHYALYAHPWMGESIAEDLTPRVFLDLERAFPLRLRSLPRPAAKIWLYRRLHEHIRDYSVAHIVSTPAIGTDAPLWCDPVLQPALSLLSERERRCIFARIYGHFTWCEIAEVMDLDLDTIARLMSRGVVILDEALDKAERRHRHVHTTAPTSAAR